jgi:hypothetical protein
MSNGHCYTLTLSTDGHGFDVWAEDHDGLTAYVGWAPTRAMALELAARDSRR